MASAFQLEKWYVDVVAEDGRTFIGYVAHLRWWGLSLRYFGYLYLDAHNQVHQVNRFRKVEFPQRAKGELAWKVPGLSGSWLSHQQAQNETLLNHSQGYLHWHCVMPNAVGQVQLEGHGLIEGRGYAEHIHMTIPPWQLPISQLYWGRWLSPAGSIVWIRWKSSTSPKILLFHNGIKYEAASIEEHQLQFGRYQLCLSKSCELRSGLLDSTVLSQAGWIKHLFPRSIQSLRETKWRSQGILSDDSGMTADGWAIHEMVDWSRG